LTAYLEIDGIDVSYEKVRALSQVSLRVDQGDIVALIGANGAGKTTTLRAVTGLSPIARGKIWFAGQRIDQMRTDRIMALGIAMVPEGRHVYPFMSVRDNLLMGAFLRTGKNEIRRDLERMFKRFPRLKERVRQLGGTLSGGEQQMVAIARALMSRPKLLLLDEPSLGLAPQLVRDIARSILQINREDGVSTVLVEQNSRMALRVSHRAYVLATGKIELEGRSADLLQTEAVKHHYLGG
jgi:branched-chain amino acid transport system ATP-binding protein